MQTESMVNDLNNFKQATSDFNKSSSALYDAVKKDLDKKPENDIPVKQQINILYKDLFKNKESSSSNAYQSQTAKLDDSLKAMSTSFGSMADHFSDTVNKSVLLVNVLSDTLGISLGKDAKKIIKDAQTVAKVVNTASATFKGFVAGGYTHLNLCPFSSS